MKNLKLLFLAVAFLAITCAAKSATNVIIAGDDFQSKIDAAVPGDTLVVQGGVYSGNLNFTKPLTIVRSGTNQLQFTGNASVSTTGLVIFSQVQFAATLQASTNAAISIFQTICSGAVTLTGGVTLTALDSQFLSLDATGGKLTLKHCSFSSDLVLNNTALEALRLTSPANINCSATVGSGTRFILVQSTFANLSASGVNAWIAYDVATTMTLTDCQSVLVGNRLDPGNPGGTSAALRVIRGDLKAYQNRITISTANNFNHEIFGMWLTTSTAEIVNNTISIFHSDQTVNGLVRTRGIVGDNACSLTLRANVISIKFSHSAGYLDDACVDASIDQVRSISYCNLFVSCCGPGWTAGTGVNNQFFTDPLLNADLSLGAGSPCIDAGPPEGIYNDRDGSRNDMGYTGGPLWNSGNYTNNLPMVFWLMPTNQTVLKGLQPTIPISAAATAGH